MAGRTPSQLAEMKTSKVEYAALAQQYSAHLPKAQEASARLQAIMGSSVESIALPGQPVKTWRMPRPDEVLDQPVEFAQRPAPHQIQPMAPPPLDVRKTTLPVFNDALRAISSGSLEKAIFLRNLAQRDVNVPAPLQTQQSLPVLGTVLEVKDVNTALLIRQPGNIYKASEEDPDGDLQLFSTVGQDESVVENELKRKSPPFFDSPPDQEPASKQPKIIIDLVSPEVSTINAREDTASFEDLFSNEVTIRASSLGAEVKPVLPLFSRASSAPVTLGPAPSLQKTTAQRRSRSAQRADAKGAAPLAQNDNANISRRPRKTRAMAEPVPDIHQLLSTAPRAFRPVPIVTAAPADRVASADSLGEYFQSFAYGDPNDLNSVPLRMYGERAAAAALWQSQAFYLDAGLLQHDQSGSVEGIGEASMAPNSIAGFDNSIDLSDLAFFTDPTAFLNFSDWSDITDSSNLTRPDGLPGFTDSSDFTESIDPTDLTGLADINGLNDPIDVSGSGEQVAPDSLGQPHQNQSGNRVSGGDYQEQSGRHFSFSDYYHSGSDICHKVTMTSDMYQDANSDDFYGSDIYEDNAVMISESDRSSLPEYSLSANPPAHTSQTSDESDNDIEVALAKSFAEFTNAYDDEDEDASCVPEISMAENQDAQTIEAASQHEGNGEATSGYSTFISAHVYSDGDEGPSDLPEHIKHAYTTQAAYQPLTNMQTTLSDSFSTATDIYGDENEAPQEDEHAAPQASNPISQPHLGLSPPAELYSPSQNIANSPTSTTSSDRDWYSDDPDEEPEGNMETNTAPDKDNDEYPVHYHHTLSTLISAHLRAPHTLVAHTPLLSVRFYTAVHDYGDDDEEEDKEKDPDVRKLEMCVSHTTVARLRVTRFVLPALETREWRDGGAGEGAERVVAGGRAERDWLVFEVVDFVKEREGSPSYEYSSDDENENEGGDEGESEGHGGAFFRLAVPMRAVTAVFPVQGRGIAKNDGLKMEVDEQGQVRTVEPHKVTRMVFGKHGRLPVVQTGLHAPTMLDAWVEACGKGEATVEVVTRPDEVGVWE